LTTLAFLTVVVAAARPANAADPTMSECLSANETAIKLRSDHKLRQARDEALVCAASSCPGEVREACQKRVTELNTAIPSIVFEVKDTSGSDVSAVVVTMDGQPFAASLGGTAIPVDPGDHTFSFAAAGQPSMEKHVLIYEGDKGRRERIQLGAAAAVPASVGFDIAASRAGDAVRDSTRDPATTGSASSELGTQKIVGLALGGVGVVGIGVGSALGLLTVSAWSGVKNACGSGGASSCAASNPSTVTSDHNTAQTDGAISTVAFIAGGVLFATGLVVFLTGGHHGREESPASAVAVVPSVGPGQARVALTGTF
jgi:hypothetical protein